MTVLERTLRDFKFELPSAGVKRLEVDAATVADPKAALERALQAKDSARVETMRADVVAFAARFRSEHGYELVFEPAAVERLVREADAAGRTVRALCEERFRHFEHGLQLLLGREGTEAFTITDAVAADPQGELSRRVVERFRGPAS
jgi:hypothetical protein